MHTSFYSLLLLALSLLPSAGYAQLVPFRTHTPDQKGKWGYRDAQTLRTRTLPEFDWADSLRGKPARAIVSKNGRYGAVNAQGEICIPMVYEALSPFSDDLAAAQQYGKAGYITTENAVAIPFRYEESFPFQDGVARVKQKGMYGYINTKGEPLTPPHFAEAADFREGMALVQKDGKYGFVKRDGSYLVPPTWTFAKSFVHGLAVVSDGEKFGAINLRGELEVPLAADEAIRVFPERLVLFRKEGKWGLHELRPAQYQNAHPAEESLALLQNEKGIWEAIQPNGKVKFTTPKALKSGVQHALIQFEEEGKVGLLDTTGKVRVEPLYEELEFLTPTLLRVSKQSQVELLDATTGHSIEGGRYDAIIPLPDGLLKVQLGKKYGLINEKGSVLLKLDYDEIENYLHSFSYILHEGGEYGLANKQGEIVLPLVYEEVIPLSNGLIKVHKGGLWGLYTTEGEVVLPVEYHEITPFLDGKTVVRKGERFAIFNAKGRRLVKFKYDYIQPQTAEPLLLAKRATQYGYLTKTGQKASNFRYTKAKAFADGRAAVNKDGTWGFMNEEGKLFIPMQFEEAEGYCEGRALVKQKGKYGYLGAQTWKVKPRYEDARSYHNGYAAVQTGGKWGMINLEGKEVIAPRYDLLLDFQYGSTWGRLGNQWECLNAAGEKLSVEEDETELFLGVKLPFVWSRGIQSGLYGLRGPGKELLFPFAAEAISSHIGQNRIFLKMNEAWHYLSSKNEIIRYGFQEVDYSVVASKAPLKLVKQEGKYGFFNTQLERLTIAPIYDKAEPFTFIFPEGDDPITGDAAPRKGYAKVEKGGQWGLIDLEGKTLLPLEYEEVSHFAEGLVKVRKGGKYGFANENAQLAIDATFDAASDFRNGVAKVKKDKRWGLLNPSGTLSVPTEYAAIYFTNKLDALVVEDENGKRALLSLRTFETPGAEDFYDEMALFFVGDVLVISKQEGEGDAKSLKQGLMNAKGEVIIPPSYDEIGSTEEAPYAVRKGDKWGFVDARGKEVLPFQYDEAESFNEIGQALVRKGKKQFFINMKGEREELREVDDSFFDIEGGEDW